MQLSDNEITVLQALADAHPDRGTMVSVSALAPATPDLSVNEIREALTGLKEKALISLDDDAAEISDSGAAALHAM